VNDYVPGEDVEAPISLTARTGAGYDAALLTVRANDADQFVQRLAELTAVDALGKAVEFNTLLQEKAGAAPAGSAPARSTGTPSRSGQAPRGAASSNSDVEYHPEGLKCAKAGCGAPVIYKKIKAKTGKTFEMWVCENQRERNDGHHSEFIN
jgi:hypothetical protein